MGAHTSRSERIFHDTRGMRLRPTGSDTRDRIHRFQRCSKRGRTYIPSGRRGAEPSYISGSESSRCLGQEPEDLPPAWAFGAVLGRAAADTCAVFR